MKSHSRRDKIIKCRTCLEQSDLSTSVNITEEYVLGKSIKDILLFFIPEMIKSSLVGEFMCSKCIKRIRNFIKFIETCLTVEKFLVEEDIKNERKIASEQANSVPLNVIYIDLPTINQNGVQSGVQPIQIQPIPINYLLATTDNTSINLENNTMPVSQMGSQNARHSNLPEIKEQVEGNIEDLKPALNGNYSMQTDDAEATGSPDENQVDFKIAAVGNRLCRTCGDVFTSDVWTQVECSKCAEGEKDIEFNISDVEVSVDLPLNDMEIDDDSDDLEAMVDTNRVLFRKKPQTNSLLKTLRGTFRDTIISVPQPSDQIDEFLEEFSKNDIRIIEYGPYNHTENKRILFLGNSSQCSQCKTLLKNPKALKVHFQETHALPELNSEEECEEEATKKLFECPFCDVKESTGLSLVEHLRQMHTIENPFKCEKCGKEFKKREVYLDHTKRFQNSPDCSLKKCRFCDEMLSKGEYQQHVKGHRDIVCDQCGRNFLNIHNFKSHYATHQAEDEKLEDKAKVEQSHLCPICGKLLSNSQSWKHHITIHGQRSRDFICHMCPKTFLTSYSLKNHIATSHVEKKYVCSICGIKVKTNAALVNHHNLKHSEIHSHICKICGKGFSRGDYFRRHMKSHANSVSGGRTAGKKKYNYSVKIESKPVKCKYCLRIFKNVYLLRTHLLGHVKSMRYKCKFCNMTFANTGTRFRHQKRHADPNFDLSCTVCWKRMDSKEELEEHLARHEESKKYECMVCEELFASKYLLKHHVSEQHIPLEEVEKEKEIVLANALEEFLL